MEKADIKEHYRKDIQFHLRCAIESIEKLNGELDAKNVEEVGEIEHNAQMAVLITLART